MAHDPFPPPPPLHGRASGVDPFPLALWAIWTLTVVATAVWVAWPALGADAPVDTLRLIVLSALMGATGLLALTVLEIRLAPWRFLDEV